MRLDWQTIDRWLMGEAWTGSRLTESLTTLCDEVGVRWAGTENERRAAEWLAGEFDRLRSGTAVVEAFPLQTWNCQSASIELAGLDGWQGDARPCLFCPPIDATAHLTDVGFGMPHELAAHGDSLSGSIALVDSGLEPFSEPRHLTLRLRDLAEAGSIAAITPNPNGGRRLQHMSAGDWRDGNPRDIPLPLVQTSREDAGRLRRAGNGAAVRLFVESEFSSRTSWNVRLDLAGSQTEKEPIVVGSHHDTTPDSFGANDNGAGVAVLLETARLLTGLNEALQVGPGRPIRFVSFGAEEQRLQGSAAFVKRHYSDQQPSLMIALDELAAGPIKGVVLQFPKLRPFIQQQLDSMNDGLQCHVLSQLDASGDMFPFARRGIPVAFLWRWRFVGRHPDVAFGHSSSDTPDKVRIRELKEYAGELARLLLRLSHVPGEEWPKNELDVEQIARRLDAERGAVFRTM